MEYLEEEVYQPIFDSDGSVVGSMPIRIPESWWRPIEALHRGEESEYLDTVKQKIMSAFGVSAAIVQTPSPGGYSVAGSAGAGPGGYPAPNLAQSLLWNIYLEVVFDANTDPADWLEAKPGADVDADLITYLKGLIRNYFPGGSKPISHHDVENFVEAEFNHAVRTTPPQIRRGFAGRIILSTMFPSTAVKERIKERDGIVASAAPVSQDATPVGPHVAVGHTESWRSAVEAANHAESKLIDSITANMALCYVCVRVSTSRRSSSGIPVCQGCLSG